MKIYVIGKYEDKELIKTVMSELIAAGHTITHDWTEGEDPAKYIGAPRLEVQRRAAEEDMRGAMTAEAVVVIHNDKLCNGLIEIGMALADPQKLVLIIGEQNPCGRRVPIFYWLSRVRFFNRVSDVVQFLKQVSKFGWE